MSTLSALSLANGTYMTWMKKTQTILTAKKTMLGKESSTALSTGLSLYLTVHLNIDRQYHSPKFEGTIHLRIRNTRQTNIHTRQIFKFQEIKASSLCRESQQACLGTTTVLKQERH